MSGSAPDPRLAAIASDTLALPAIRPTDEELALIELLHGILGPRLAALMDCDVAWMATEPNLDPGRAPRMP